MGGNGQWIPAFDIVGEAIDRRFIVTFGSKGPK